MKVRAVPVIDRYLVNELVSPFLFGGALFTFFLVFIFDSVLLSRRIKKTLAERLPNENPKGAVWYGVSRSTMIRRWRFPKPEVGLGADV